ncbi:DUF2341 domain-containing protein [Candidatus Woesearchaeota archaeon]|nr:DUF2341 domain-containing protein [Candidatus Woesearchaeota archaeon]
MKKKQPSNKRAARRAATLLSASLILLLTAIIVAAAPPITIDIDAPEHATTGETITVNIKATVQGIPIISYHANATLAHPDGAVTRPELRDLRNGTKQLNITLTQPGDHILIIEASIGGTAQERTLTITAEEQATGSIDVTYEDYALGILSGTIIIHDAHQHIITLTSADTATGQEATICGVENCRHHCTFSCAADLDANKPYRLTANAPITGATTTTVLLPAQLQNRPTLLPQEQEAITASTDNETATALNITGNEKAYLFDNERTHPITINKGSVTLPPLPAGKYTLILTDGTALSAITVIAGSGTPSQEQPVTDPTRLTLTKDELTKAYDPYYGQAWYTATITINEEHDTLVLENETGCAARNAALWHGNKRTTLEQRNDTCTWKLPGTTGQARIEVQASIAQASITHEQLQTSIIHEQLPRAFDDHLISVSLNNQAAGTYRYVTPLPGAATPNDHPYDYAIEDQHLIWYASNEQATIPLSHGREATIPLQRVARQNDTYQYRAITNTTTAHLIIPAPYKEATITADHDYKLPEESYHYPYLIALDQPTAKQILLTTTTNHTNDTITAISKAPTMAIEGLPSQLRKQDRANLTLTTPSKEWNATPNATIRLLDREAGTVMAVHQALAHEENGTYHDQVALDLAAVTPGAYTLIATFRQGAAYATTTEEVLITGEAGGFSITPGKHVTAAKGEDVNLQHAITNLESERSLIINLDLLYELENVTATIKDDEGVKALTDNDKDGRPDTGILLPGETVIITINGRVPAWAENETKVIIKASAASQARSIEDDITITSQEDIIIPAYHDLAITGIEEEDGTVLITIINNDENDRTAMVEVTLKDKNFTDTITVPVSVRARDESVIPVQRRGIRQPYECAATLLDEEGLPYADDKQANDRRVRLFNDEWTEPYTRRAAVAIKEVRGADHDAYAIKATIDLPDDADMATMTAVKPAREGGAFTTKTLSITYLSFDDQEKRGELLIDAGLVKASTESLIYLYLNATGENSTVTVDEAAGIIIDNNDRLVSTDGTWASDYQVPGHYKADYLHDLGIGKGNKAVTVKPGDHPSFTPSTYEVYAYRPADRAFSSNAKTVIAHEDGEETITQNQRVNGEEWRYLGLYRLGDSSTIITDNEHTNGLVVFDALRLLRVDQYATTGKAETRAAHDNRSITLEEDGDERNYTFTLDMTIRAHANVTDVLVTSSHGNETVALNTTRIDDAFMTAYRAIGSEQRYTASVVAYDGNETVDLTYLEFPFRDEREHAVTKNTTLLLLQATYHYGDEEAAEDEGNATVNRTGEAENKTIKGWTTIVSGKSTTIRLPDTFEGNATNATYGVYFLMPWGNASGLNISIKGENATLSANDEGEGDFTAQFNRTWHDRTERSAYVNITILPAENITNTTEAEGEPVEAVRQEPATVGEPVRWTKYVQGEWTTRIPVSAENVALEADGELVEEEETAVIIAGKRLGLADFRELRRAELLEREADELELEKEDAKLVRKTAIALDQQDLRGQAESIKESLGVDLDDEENVTLVIDRPHDKKAIAKITYETEAPLQEEEHVGRPGLLKRVKVHSSASVHYQDVKTMTWLPETPITPRLYHVIDGRRVDVTDNKDYRVSFNDADGDGMADSASWTVPMLSEQYFEFGLATINTRKSLYRPGETAEVVIVVLDNEGHLVSGADVEVNVTEPDNTTTRYTTGSGHITETEPGIYDLSHGSTANEGRYGLSVKATKPGVENDMQSHFDVQAWYPFDILRDVPVTVDPWREELEASITVVAYNHTDSFSLKEHVPTSFLISDAGGAVVSENGSRKTLTWTGLTNGSVASYTASLPLITPTMYDLGEAKITYGNSSFTEGRPWYLAVDPIEQFTKTCLNLVTEGAVAGDNTGTCAQVATSNNTRPAGGDNALTAADNWFGTDAPAVLTETFDANTPTDANVSYAYLTIEWGTQDCGSPAYITMEVNNGTGWYTFANTCYTTPEATRHYDLSGYVTTGDAANELQIRITYGADRDGGDTTDDLYVDYIDLVINYTVAPHYNTWSLNVSNGAVVRRGTPVKAYAYWNYSDGIAESYIKHNANGTYHNYTIMPSGDWTNYTFNTPNTTMFNRVGIITAQTIYARDYDVWNQTAPTKNFKLYDDANVSDSTLTPSIINQSDNATLICKVMDYHLNSPIEDFTVYFYRDGAYKASAKTNATGWASYDAAYTTPGTYNVSCRIKDSGYYYALAGANSSYGELTVLDSSSPSVSLVSPADSSQSTNQNVTFTYTVSDTYSGIQNCSLYLNSTRNASNSTVITESGSNQINVTLPYGTYVWAVGCYDNSTNRNFKLSANRTIVVAPDSEGPVITHYLPPNTGMTYENVTFLFNVEDALSGVKNCTLILDGLDNVSNASISNGDNVSFDAYLLDDGLHSWKVRCYDDSPAENVRTSIIWTFTVGEDEDGPIITVISPLNNTVDTDGKVNITFIADDFLSGVENCSLYINDTLNQTYYAKTVLTMPFGAGSNSTFTADESGNGNDGTVINATWGSSTGYNGEGSYYFDGASAYIDIPSLAISNSPGFTIMMWVKGPPNQNDMRIFSEGSTIDHDPLFNLGTNIGGGELDIYIRDDDGTERMSHVLSSADVFDNTWHHIAWVDVGGNYQLYVDGEPDISGSYTKTAKSLDTTTLGAIRRAAVSHYFTGYIDEVELFNQSLSAEQIRAEYANVSLVEGEETIFSEDSFSEGTYAWHISCVDDSINSNVRNTSIRILYVNYDFDSPDITLVWPDNLYQDLDGELDLEYNVTDENGISNCSLYINGSYNRSDTSVTKGVSQYFSLTGLADNTYLWYVNCTDDADGENWNYSETRNFSVGPDTIGPAITLFAPSNSTTDSDGDILFTYQVDDVSSGVDSCRLYVDGVEEDSDGSITESIEQEFSFSLANGDYEWYINCTDDSPQQNIGVSETRDLTVSISYESEYDFYLPKSTYAAGSVIEPVAHLEDPGSAPIASATAYAYIIENLGADNQTLSWFNSSWERRIEQLVTNDDASYALEGFPINITLDTETLINDGLLNADCSDLRFADQEGTELDHYFYDADNACDDTGSKVLVYLDRLWKGRTHAIGIYFNNSAATADVTTRSASQAVDNFDDGDTFPSGSGYWSTSYTNGADEWYQDTAQVYDGTNAAHSYISCNIFCSFGGGRRSSFSKVIEINEESTIHWRWYVTGGSAIRFSIDSAQQTSTTAASWNAASATISPGTHTIEWEFEVTTNANRNAYVDQIFLVGSNATVGDQTSQSTYVATLPSKTTDANGNATFSWDSIGQSYGNYSVTGHALKGAYWGDNGSISFSLGPDTEEPTYTSWGLNVSDGAAVTRGESVKAYAYWSDDVQLDDALLEHNGSGSFTNYSITGFGGAKGDWANYTLNTSDTTDFASIGLVNVSKMYANDTTGNTNKTTPYHYFFLYSTAEINDSSLNATAVDEGSSFTAKCRVRDEYTFSSLSGYTVTFYFDGVSKGSVDTDSGGWANKSIQSDVPGDNVEVVCVIGNETSMYYYRGSPYSLTQHINITDIYPPDVTIFTPANKSTKTTPTHALSFTADDTGTLDRCWLYGDWNGGWHRNQTMMDPDNGGFPFVNYFDPVTFEAGNYTWNVYCNDTAGNMGVMGDAWFIIDLQQPNVQITSPAFHELRSPGTHLVNYTVQLPDPIIGIDNCTLYVDGAYNQTDPGPIEKVVNQNFTIGYLGYGKYLINISCTANNTLSGYDTEFIYIPRIRTYAPVNGSAAERDPLSAMPDDLTFMVEELSGGSDISITFKANHTSPSLGVLQNESMGVSLTNATGIASSTFNPGAAWFAGNYTWWGMFTWWPSNVTVDYRWFLLYGYADVVFREAASGPGASYVYREEVTVQALVDSTGPESASVMNQSYGARANATFRSPRKESNLTYELVFNGTSWTVTQNSSLFRRHGFWNVSLEGNVSSPFISINDTSWRTFFLNLTGYGIPTVQLHDPDNDSTLFFADRDKNWTLISFNWTANDTIEDFTYCNLTLDGSVNVSDVKSLNATWTDRNINFTGGGYHYWNVSCSDDANAVASDTYMFKIVPPDSRVQLMNYTLGGGNATVYEQVNFTANYTNYYNESIIGNCTIRFNDGLSDSMTYNITSELYEYERNMTYGGWIYWNVSCNHTTYYDTAVANASYYTHRTKVNVTAPSNGTALDRDGTDGGVPDSAVIYTLLAKQYPGVNISFWANRTYPDSWSVEYLGMNQTNATGHTSLVFDPNSTFWAGNYTLFTNSSLADPMMTKYAYVKGTLNVTFSYAGAYPNASYYRNSTVEARFNVTSMGAENSSLLDSYYLDDSTLRAYYVSPSGTDVRSLNLSLVSGDVFNASSFMNTTAELDLWNVSANYTETEYFFFNQSPTRQFNLTKIPTTLTAWDQYGPEEGYVPAYRAENVSFYANFTNNITGAPISISQSCNFSFGDGMWAWGAWNATSGLHEVRNKSFDPHGLYAWNVTCGNWLYQYRSWTDSIRVYARTNLSLTGSLSWVGDDRLRMDISIVNYAVYDEWVNAYGFIPLNFSWYGFSPFGPDATTAVSGLFVGNASETNLTVPAAGSLPFSFLINRTAPYNTRGLFMFGGG